MTPEQEKALIKYCEDNPVTIYADYRDELSAQDVETLFEKGADSFWESLWESEFNMQDSWYSYGFRDYKEEALRACDIEELEDDSILYENITFDFSDFWRDCANNTRVKVTLTPINPETNEPFYTVHHNQLFDYMLDNARALRKYFGMRNFRKIESCYDHESLKICGYVDLWHIIENGMPEKWTINPGDSCVFHTSFNGSGALGDFKIEKQATLECRVQLDDSNRYGVGAVYGFCGSFWRETELTPSYTEKENNQ
jgi:hypothetical protein